MTEREKAFAILGESIAEVALAFRHQGAKLMRLNQHSRSFDEAIGHLSPERKAIIEKANGPAPDGTSAA